ncbi:unnamed protein product [Prorocentrum cordatum]|uniref:Endopeptidase S2P n=1 Tax=Prorocentrum cordatum TaxID=2364126 RepID=A0ABN9V2X0_9DINO|nr:unnamed protein product [Polarella glacialis]
MVNELVVTLNDMYLGGRGHDDLPRRAAGEPLLAVHAEVHRELEDAVRRFGEPPMDLDGPGALAELRVSQAHRGEAVAIAPVGFDNVDRISLPAATTSPQTLERLAGDVGRKIANRLQELLLPREQGLDRIRTEGPRRLYVDPNLRNPKLYQGVFRRLVDSNLVSFQLDCECSVGLFFVHKKNGDLRMILDGRYSSLRFGEADKVELASGGAFSQIAVDGDDPIAVAGVDIADAFYNILLPPWLQKYFGLPPVRAGDFNLSHVGEGIPVHPSQKVVPCLRCPPMGWSVSLWICQTLNEHISSLVPGVSTHNLFVDRRPAPSLSDDFIHTEYVDNFVSLSRSVERAGDIARAVGRELNRVGLPTHEVEEGVGGQTLGWEFGSSDAVIGLNPRLRWRLRLGIQEILRQDRCTGDTLWRVISHYTSRGLIRRELLSALGAVYSFIRVVSCVDVSWWGVGIAEKDFSHDQVVELSSFNERWRFGRDSEKSMPPRAFDIGMWEDETEETETSTGFTEPYHVQEASKGLMFKEPIKVFLKPSEAKFRSVSKEGSGRTKDQRGRDFVSPPPGLSLYDEPRESHSVLEQESVSAATCQDYERRAHYVYLGVEHSRLETVAEEQLHKALVTYFRERFLEGGESMNARKLLALLAFAGCHLGLKYSSLRCATRTARGGRKRAPPRSMLRLPWAAGCLVIRQIAQARNRVLAHLTAVALALYLMPSEAISPTSHGLAPPSVLSLEGSEPAFGFVISTLLGSKGPIAKVGVALLFGTLSFVILFFTVFIHELGHCAGAKVVGGRAHRILLWPLGGLAFVSGGGGSAGDLVIALAGPATHLPMYFAWNELRAAAVARGAADVLVQVCASGARLQVMLAAFNLLVPAYPLDCSQALVALLRLCGVPAKASAWFIIVCSLACLVLIVCCMVRLVHVPMLPSGYNSMSIIMVLWLGFQTYRRPRPPTRRGPGGGPAGAEGAHGRPPGCGSTCRRTTSRGTRCSRRGTARAAARRTRPRRRRA